MKLLKLLILTILITVLTVTSLLADEVYITVYNQNLGLVHEVRDLNFEKGYQEFSYDGVAASIDPTSVRFKGSGVNVLEQNFEFDLVNRKALMDKYVGESVVVQLEKETVIGKLLSTAGGMIIEDSDGEVRIISNDAILSVNFPELPDGLILKPTLRWLLHSEKEGTVKTELDYLTHNIDWEASYVAVVNRRDTKIDFNGWVQLTNKSGADYADATLKLMAGDLNVASQHKGRNMMRTMAMDESFDGGGFQEKSFFEYHLYTLPRKVTINNNQTKQISLIEPATTPIKKIYTYNAFQGGKKIGVQVEFVNSEKNNLGIALPEGKVRLYKKDDDGTLQFIGEDRINHTPKDEEVSLTLGDAFDIVAERVMTNSRNMGVRTREDEYSIELRNHKETPVEIVVKERFGRKWEILMESDPGKITNATSYEWKISVPANGSTKMVYKVRIN